ncbi:MAG: carbon monoxide dehydrogenase accessory protein CooC [Dissulfurispiraceae bacterium]|jgi:CO dehydrogenase maturation factor|nr:carbon monoxide dehydrogenase accessory protein CooC [Dissulfurispiraceae bacterium]
MKLAITGKGGVGKTTLSAVLSHLFVQDGRKVIAVDADPDANLAQALGMTPSEIESIKPISDMADLIEERTGARPGSSAKVFRINPKVDDIPEGFGHKVNGVTLLIMGKSKLAGSGCYCPENVFLKRLLKHLVLERDEVVIVDMEAGIEHLTRGTSEAVDAMIVVVEPGKRSVQTAHAVKDLAAQMGVKNIFVVVNKVRGDEDIAFIGKELFDMNILGHIKLDTSLMDADLHGEPPFARDSDAVESIKQIKTALHNFVPAL